MYPRYSTFVSLKIDVPRADHCERAVFLPLHEFITFTVAEEHGNSGNGGEKSGPTPADFRINGV